MYQSRLTGILPYLPGKIRRKLEKTEFLQTLAVEEVRLRANAPLTLGILGESCFVTETGGITNHEKDAYRVSKDEVQAAYLAICENSVYAHMEEIRQGFLTLKGGHRVGICGKAVVEDGKIKAFREISSLNFRIAHQIFGAADGIMDALVKEVQVVSTLIISPPQTGKTTLLRDAVRQISNAGFKVGVVDDRGELGAMYQGAMQNDLGAQTDLIDGAPKADGISLLLRTMSPKVIASDEIATKSDADAILLAHGTGVSVLATTHGDDLLEVRQRTVLKPLFEHGVFQQVILLSRDFSNLDSKAETKVIPL